MKSYSIIGLMMTCYSAFGQGHYYTAVNPSFFSYKDVDVFINQPTKYNNGNHILSPAPMTYPWEERLENGMPNVLVDEEGNVSVYFSSFIAYSPVPLSRMGTMLFENQTNNPFGWTRPDLGLYWYNANGATADERITPNFMPGYQNTNIVAVDIESVGIFDDRTNSQNPIKVIYTPQREFYYKYLGAYEMARSFSSQGMLNGWSDMKDHRRDHQKVFTFSFINADTHMNWMLRDGVYSFSSRINGRRSVLKPTEVPPLSPDPRIRYRRSTISVVGETIDNMNLDKNVVLDCSTRKWEPYSMQPFRLPGYDDDVYFGLVTMYGLDAFPDVAARQRTELAISSNGKDWRYLKAGTPFLDNGESSEADDHGCINIATPVFRTKLHSESPLDPYFFYASSSLRHVEGRNPGLSLAKSKFGKLAGLKTTGTKVFSSPTPLTWNGYHELYMPNLSIPNAFAPFSVFYPSILADVTEDPSERDLPLLDSYCRINMYAYDESAPNGKGMFLGGSMGSAQPSSHVISDDFMSVDFTYSGKSSHSKQFMIDFIKDYSDSHPTEIISFNDFTHIPIVLESSQKNSTFYSLFFSDSPFAGPSIVLRGTNDIRLLNLWSYTKMPPQTFPIVSDLSDQVNYPNATIATKLETGALAAKVTFSPYTTDQTVVRILGDDDNFQSLDYFANGDICYRLMKDGLDYIKLVVSPPSGQSFVNHSTIITVECVKNQDRKYMRDNKEEVTIMRVKCPDLNFEQTVSQDIIWNSRHAVPNAVDSCYARGFAYLAFSGFVGEMDKIIVGALSETGGNIFQGTIDKVELSDKLPTSPLSDFWTEELSVAAIDNKKIKH